MCYLLTYINNKYFYSLLSYQDTVNHQSKEIWIVLIVKIFFSIFVSYSFYYNIYYVLFK